MGRCSFGAASTAMVGVYHRWFLCVLCVVREKGCVHGLLIGSQSIRVGSIRLICIPKKQKIPNPKPKTNLSTF